MKILIAEDDVTARLILAGCLKKLGHEPILTVNGTQAWELIQQENSPRIIILDWMMPEMDGIEVCKRIRTLSNSYRYVIMQTSKGQKQDIDLGFQVGVDDYLTKPIDPEALRHKLHVAERVLSYENKLAEYASEMESLAKKRAQQLIHADRMATLGMLSAGVAHEINNPLTFISGNAQTLNKAWSPIADKLSENPDDFSFVLEEFPKMIAGIQTGVSRISKIVSGLKRFARQDSVVKKEFSLTQCITNTLDFCRSQLRNTAVDVDVNPNLPLVFGDMQQIEQVLINLIVNAADAMKNTSSPHIWIRAERLNAHIVIFVTDCGPGLPEKLLSRLINPFFTTKVEGTGLGLSISANIIEEHGGSFSASNHPNGGAQFTFTLPISNNGVPT